METRHEEWLKRAKSSLEIAKFQATPVIQYEDLCFQAQQAAEKAIKGLLIYYKTEPEFTHSIQKLLNDVTLHISVPDEIREAIKLTKYAAFTRYPGMYDELTKEEYEESVVLASRCIEWVERLIAAKEKEAKTT